MKIDIKTKYHFSELWCFVAFTFGVVAYFGMPWEIPVWIWGCLFGVSGALVFAQKTQGMKIFFFLLMGTFVASLRTSLIQTEFLEYPQWKKEIIGRVQTAYDTHKGQTVILKDLKIDAPFVPKLVRVRFEKKFPKINEGDIILFEGNLYPIRRTQRMRYFYQEIGAQGQIVRLIKQLKGRPSKISKIRSNIIDKLQHHLNDQQAEIAVPLVVGEQQIVSEKLYEIYRKAGIAHVLSVSGFHMALLAGFVFFLMRGLFSLIPCLSMRLDAKKWGAVVAFFVTGLYLFLSGAQIPALRAFMMISIVFLGVLINRKSFSLYALFLVGFCLLLFRPEWITSVSFQLSFAAVMVFVGIFEEVMEKLPRIRFINFLVTLVVANILVSFVLAPFVIYHFNQFNPYGVIGNLLTTLLFSFWVMPLLFLGTICMPFSCEGVFLKMAGIGLDIITKIANHIASFPHSEITVSSFSAIGLTLVAFGLCLVCIIKNRYRFVGLGMMILGVYLGYLIQKMPDIIVVDKGKTILVRENGDFSVRGNLDNWLAKQWLRKNGQRVAPEFKQDVVFLKDKKIVFMPDECEKADLAILSRKNGACKAKEVFLPKKREIYLIYVTNEIKIEPESKLFSERPWENGVRQKEEK